MEENDLIQVELVNQPKIHWKPRTLACLSRGECPEIQSEGGDQRQYLVLQVIKLIY